MDFFTSLLNAYDYALENNLVDVHEGNATIYASKNFRRTCAQQPTNFALGSWRYADHISQ